MLIHLPLLTVFLTQLLNANGTATHPTELEALAQKALARVESMRKQKLKAPLKMGVKSRSAILKFIQSRLNDEYGPQKVQAEGWLLENQGFIEPGTDYGKVVTDLLTEQVAGFYDHTQQELHIADWLPVAVQEPVMAHEIFHAIQDQEWGGGKLLNSKKYGHDQVLAHAALLEGDATIVMLNYSQPAGAGIDMSTSAVTMNLIAASLPLQMSSAQFPTMAAAPDYLKQSLIFPYQQGLLFVAALRQAGQSWDQIREVYRDPPSSTEQILHPKKYYQERDEPSKVTLPDDLLAGFKVRWRGTCGEFHMRQILLQALDTAQAVLGAMGWDGDDTVVLWNGQKHVTVTHSVWDSKGEAAEFENRLEKMAATLATRQKNKGSTYGSPFIIREGDIVTFAFSEDTDLAERVARKAAKRGVVKRR